jgi:hypothetical protein
MPQVSADAHLPVPPDAARVVAESLPTQPLRVPPHIHRVRASWRFRPEADGSLAIHTVSYAGGPGWVAALAHEPTQWMLRRQAVRRVERLAEACRSGREEFAS